MGARRPALRRREETRVSGHAAALADLDRLLRRGDRPDWCSADRRGGELLIDACSGTGMAIVGMRHRIRARSGVLVTVGVATAFVVVSSVLASAALCAPWETPPSAIIGQRAWLQDVRVGGH